MLYIRAIIILLLLLFKTSIAIAQECQNRGALASNYCDNNHDLTADQPQNHAEWVNPKTLILSFAPFEKYIQPSTIFTPLISHLESCLQRRVIFYPMQSNEAELAAMRSGRVHIAAYSTGSIVAAVNQVGAVPFVTHGNDQGIVGANLIVIVRKDSPYQQLADLKNRRVIHSSPTSLTGHLGALALFPKEGLYPGMDYPIIFSGKHDLSIQGVKSGDYDAATTTTEIFYRMIQHKEIETDDFRILYQSQTFPSAAFTYAHNLDPHLKKEIRECFINYQFKETSKQLFPQAQYFIPVDYKKDWAEIRHILDAAQ